MALDNRTKDKSIELEEIENDQEPIVESEQAREDEDAIETEEQATDQSEEPLEDTTEDQEEKPQEDVEPEKTKPKQEPDIEERYKEQRRESQILHERNQQILDAHQRAEQVKEPTEEELKTWVRTGGSEWEELSAFERSMARNTYLNEKKLDIINSVVKDVKDIDEWAGKVDTFLDENETKQTHKQIVGRENDFRSFAMKASHRGLPLEVLVGYFLYQAPPVKKQKGSMFLTNGGGERPKQKTNIITDAEEASRLRATDHREYERRVRAGEIQVEV